MGMYNDNNGANTSESVGLCGEPAYTYHAYVY